MSRLDESSSAKPKTWADLLDTDIYTKSKKSFLLLRVIGQKIISKKKLMEYFQDEGVEMPPVIIDIKDGMLVSFQSDEEAWPFRSKSDTIQVDDVKLRVFPKDVPPLHENAFIVKVEDCKESDMKKYFQQFHEKNHPQPVIQSLPRKDCFSVTYQSEAADVSKIKKSLKKIPFNGKHLTIKAFCRTDCIRVTKLKDDATDDEIREGCKKHGHYRMTHVEKATKKSAFVYFANYEDAEDLIKKTSATSKIKVGDFDANVSLYYHPETISETTEAASTSTRQSSKKTLAPQFPSQPSTSAAAKSSTSSADAGRGKDRPRASNGNSSSSAADLILVPCVPHGVLEFVMQLPEPNDELKKEFEREGTVSFVRKQIFSVKGNSFHYVVHLKLSKPSQNAANASGREEQKFEAELQKRLDRFFERFSSESEEFDTYRLKLLRSEFGWDRDSDLLAIALDADNMVQVHVRWNHMKEGNVTVSGYKSQVGKVLKKLKDAVAKQEPPSYSGGQQRKWQNHQERESPFVMEHSLDLSSSAIRHIDALCQENEEWKMISSAVQCVPNESYTRFTVKGRPRAVAEAMQWLEAESMKLVRTPQVVDDPSLCEFLRGEKISKIVSEVEQETKCFIEIETTEPNDEWGGNKMLEPRQSLKPLPSPALSRSGQIGSIQVIVKQGDITKEDVDMIINPTGSSYDVTASQVGKALVAKGGRSIIDDCRAKLRSSWSLITPDFIVTTGGRLACRKIIHMPIEYPDRPEKFFPKLEKIFSEADKLRMRSMALPAIGTGTLCLDATKCARMTLTAIENVAKKSLKYLREIRVVLFDQTLLNTFQEGILKNSRVVQSSLYETALERPPWPTKLEARSHSSTVDRVRKPYDVERGMMTVVICSTDAKTNQEAWDSLLQRVCEGVAGEEVNETLEISLLQFLDHRKELFNLDQELQIRVEILFTKYQSKCVIYGAKDDVSRACSKARILLQMETPINDENKQRGSQVATSIVSNARETHGDEESMKEIFEDARVSWTVDGDYPEQRGRSCGLGFNNHRVDNRNTAATSSERIPPQVHHVPTPALHLTPQLKQEVFPEKEELHHRQDWQKRWRELNTPKMKIDSIVSDYEKCEKILSRFTAHGGFKVDVKEVEKIMNPSLYQRFEQRKSKIRQLLENPNRFLFYGVPSQFAYDVICTYGWNVVANDADGNQLRLAPPQFFTTSKQALHDAKPDSQGLMRMILADVIVGDHCQSFGSPGEMKDLCEKAGYHSVANKRDNPTAFTLYSELCAYPVYVVTFSN